MNISKFFGWVLLISGILIIAWTLYYSYGIFFGQNKMLEIFKLEAQNGNTSFQPSQVNKFGKLQDQTQKMVQEQLSKMVPENAIPKFLNLTAWGILAWIFIFGAAQISTIGIKLIKG